MWPSGAVVTVVILVGILLTAIFCAILKCCEKHVDVRCVRNKKTGTATSARVRNEQTGIVAMETEKSVLAVTGVSPVNISRGWKNYNCFENAHGIRHDDRLHLCSNDDLKIHEIESGTEDESRHVWNQPKGKNSMCVLAVDELSKGSPSHGQLPTPVWATIGRSEY